VALSSVFFMPASRANEFVTTTTWAFSSVQPRARQKGKKCQALYGVLCSVYAA
jgi:hypothetical protein